jgi:hypothetical protein
MNVVAKYKVIGSDSYKGLLYTTDVDLEGDLKHTTETKILHYFQSLLPNKDFLFMDFKCGLDTRLLSNDEEVDIENPLIPDTYKKQIKKASGEERVKLIRDLYILRWTLADIKKGEVQLIDGSTKLFIDCLQDNTMIKLDIALPHYDTFIDVNEVYYYKQKKVTNKQLILDIEEDVEYYHYRNTFKSLKRLYSLLLLQKKKKKIQKQLETLFNSTVGYMNKLKNDIVFFLDVCDKHPQTILVIKTHVDAFKVRYYKLKDSKNSFDTKMNRVTIKSYHRVLSDLVTLLTTQINSEAKVAFSKMT